MKMIFKIAKTELQTLFYSPVAWLILIIFTFQASILFTNVFDMSVKSQSLEYQLDNVTLFTFGGMFGLFSGIQQYLYLYIPLLTMGLMSRELSSGSIKLLYSSPVTNKQIVLGKYLAMMLYGLLLMAILSIFVIYSAFAIKSFDFICVLAGLLGLYLLTCAYSAIGLFMSSLTSYQVVSAMGTLAILAALSLVRGVWQDMEVVRDITFWLSINGRADEFVNGLICSEDVLYFIIVSALFLTLTILRLQVIRQKTNWLTAWGRYIGVFAIAIFLGYLSSRPQLMCFYDATRTKARTLTPNSQEIISKLKGDLTITTYVNMLDRNVYYGLSSAVKDDMNRFRMYTRFKPEIKMKYVYYYDSINNPSLAIRYPGLSLREQMKRIAETVDFDTNKVKTPEEIRKIIDLSGEGNRFVRLLESGNGKKTFLRIYEDFNGAFPHESEISAAFKHLIIDLPLVGFVKGHGERDIKRESDRDYKHFSQDKPFRYALINQGFDITEVDLHQGIPSNVRILVIADPRRTLSTEETEVLNSYISQGGNLFIAGEPKQQAIMNPLVEQFGVQFMPGCLVKPTENFAADLITSNPTDRATALSYIFEGMQQMGNTISMPGATGLTYSTDKGFTVTPLFTSDSTGSWNELQTTDFVEDTAQLNPELGEIERSYVTSVALSRKVGEKEQRIIIISDADCISNTEIEMMRRGINARNYSFVRGAFSWLSYEEAPIDVRRLIPPDNEVYIEKRGMKITKHAMVEGLPGLLLVLALLIWVRRRGR
ncbi:Gldg family protein [Butyricimonas virosa]|uniref:Gldg family protein n=1 Tax=Butyricimonas virosa TaxID=544645 RepID=UPI000E42D71B|nr:Gldg family protein [Butyricimonas virosa]RGL80363.1 ABC transporter [Butyricimonas virosa]